MKLELDRETLRVVFDTAINSMDFGSGFLDDEEVKALRAVAVILGVDPMVATPDTFKCKYGSPHQWISPVRVTPAWVCLACRMEVKTKPDGLGGS